MQSNEILEVVDSVSTEKGLDKDVIFKAIEIAIASASQRHFHEDADLYVKIDRETGEYSTHRNWIVFDPDNEEFHHETHISKDDSGLELEEVYTLQQENIKFGRIETQAARQVMLQKVREAERYLKGAVKYLIKQKCKKIILGCTELPVALFAYKSFKRAKESKIFIDPNLLLAQVCMKKYKN